MNDPVLINILLFLVAAFGLLVVGMVFMFIRVYSRLQRIQSQITADRASLLKKAQDTADSLVADAQKNAQAIIGNARNFNSQAEKIFETEMQKATASYADNYNNLLQTLSAKMEKLYTELSDKLSSVAASSATEFDKHVENSLQSLSERINTEVTTLHDSLSKISEDEKKSLQKEYETIRAQRIEQLESKLIAAISVIIKDSIGFSISESDNEKLILDSLKDAKEKGVFS